MGHGDGGSGAAGKAGQLTLVAIGDSIGSTHRLVIPVTGELTGLSSGEKREKEQHDERWYWMYSVNTG